MANPTYKLINSQVVGSGGASSITFSSIPQTYADLRIVSSIRTTFTGGGYYAADISMRFNNDSSSSYSYMGLTNANGTANSFKISNDTAFTYIMLGAGNDATSNTFSNNELYIPNYTSSVAKSISVDTTPENNGSVILQRLNAGIWSPATQAAINRIDIYPASAVSIMQYSTFYLYGIKNS